MTKRKQKPMPTDTELLDWLNASDIKVRAYSAMQKSALDDGAVSGNGPAWNVYNYKLGRGSNGNTVREALIAAYRADTLPAPKKKISAERAASMMLRNGVRLGELDAEQLDRLLRWARGRTKTNTLQAACEVLLVQAGWSANFAR